MSLNPVVVPVRPNVAQDALGPLERLQALCDGGSLELLRSRVRSRSPGIGAAGDGVVAATGAVAGNPVVCYAQDGAVAGGSLGEAHADTIVQALRLAGDAQLPVVAFIESAGARLQEGGRALAGYARIFRETVALSGHVPQISVVTGTAAGGGSYAPALTDFIVMTERARMFLTGPAVVRLACGEEVSSWELGGPLVHQRNGVCHLTADSDRSAASLSRELLSYFRGAPERQPVRIAMREPPAPEDPSQLVPQSSRTVYDVRSVAKAISDSGSILELAPRWARNIVTALSRIDGWPVGIVANQPRYLGGVLDAEAAEKAARFVRTCDAFGLPLVVLVDTPGFMPGRSQEACAVIRHGAKLLHAFAAATVPRLTVVLRKAYGGAYISMNSKELGANLTFAWPSAEVGIMAAEQAVGIIGRRKLERAPNPHLVRDELTAEYARQHLEAAAAAAAGLVDEVIEPAETRSRLASGLGLLCRPGGASTRRASRLG